MTKDALKYSNVKPKITGANAVGKTKSPNKRATVKLDTNGVAVQNNKQGV